MFFMKPLVALCEHPIRNLGALFNRSGDRSIAGRAGMKADAHHPGEIHIPGDFTKRGHTMVNPEAVKDTAEAVLAKA